jgi:hypothetical protein
MSHEPEPFLTEDPFGTCITLMNVGMERSRQFAKWGPQHHPDGTGSCLPFQLVGGLSYGLMEKRARDNCNLNAEYHDGTWADILLEEVFESLAEENLTLLRKELTQVAAVAVAWIEDIDSRG